MSNKDLPFEHSEEGVQSPFDRFVAAYWCDVDRGVKRTLNEYLSDFPGDDDRIAEEYRSCETLGNTSNVMIGRYRVIRALESGGQGQVYLAYDDSAKRRVALKLHLRRGSIDLEGRMRMTREAQSLARLNHPGICTVYELGEHEGGMFIAMEFIDGEQIRERFSRDRVMRDANSSAFGDKTEAPTSPSDPGGLRSVLRLFVQIAAALHAAHEAKVVHRDLKPANIMIRKNGDPVIVDFGLALVQDASQLTWHRSDVLMGSRGYMSPEQIDPRGRAALDSRTDIFSLGIIFYEALTGRHPFDAPSDHLRNVRIAESDPEAPSRFNRAISRDLDAVVLTALEKDANRRYATAREFADEIRRVIDGKPILARPSGAFVKLAKWVRRNPVPASLAAGLCLLLPTFSVVTLLNSSRLKTSERAAQENLKKFKQLASVKRLNDLSAEAERDLWPAWPQMIARFETWLKKAREERARIESLRSSYDELMRASLPPTQDDERRNVALRRRKYHEFFEDHDLKVRERETVVRSGPKSEDLQQLSKIAAEIARMESDPRFTERMVWRFADEDDEWRRDVLADLLGEIPAFDEMIRSVEARLESARSITRLTIDDPTWAACCDDLSRDPRFRSIKLRPQIDLVPLWKDRNSDLWEFWHVPSGTRPGRDEPTGRLQFQSDTGIVLVLCPGGESMMGASRTMGDSHYDPDARDNEYPVDTLTLDPFFASKFEMTQAQWQRITGKNPSGYQPANAALNGPAHPIENVDWDMCREAVMRYGLDLPTEAQWEYLCRAGTTTAYASGQKSESLRGFANLLDERGLWGGLTGVPVPWDDEYAGHAPVGSFSPNRFGLHDVHGNVWEWCEDSPADYRQPELDGAGRRNRPNGLDRVFRGGSFFRSAVDARAGCRNGAVRGTRSPDVGLRPIRRIQP